MLQGEHSAILLTCIKLPFVIKISVLPVFELPLKTGFTVHVQISKLTMVKDFLGGGFLGHMKTV